MPTPFCQNPQGAGVCVPGCEPVTSALSPELSVHRQGPGSENGQWVVKG